MALFSWLIWGVLTFVTLLVYFIFSALRRNREYFKKHGIPYIGAGLKRTFQFIKGSTNVVQMEIESYKEVLAANAPVVGLSDLFGARSVYITDLDLIRNICIRDFDNFANRRPFDSVMTNKYVMRMLSVMTGSQWKMMRAKLSPTFTTGRIRRMFQIFKTSSERMDSYIKAQIVGSSVDLDFSQLFPKYAMDVIASCSFGIDSKTWELSPEQKLSKFEQMGKKFAFRFGGINLLKILMLTCFPKLGKILDVDLVDKEAQLYFRNVIQDVIKRRRETGERRDDFLQLMMDTQQGLLKADEESVQVMNGDAGEGLGSTFSTSDGGLQKFVFDDTDVVANSMQFLAAGFDTTQSVLLFTLYCLALEPEIQEKLYEDIRSVMDKHEGFLSYEAVLEMSFLDYVINESMRLYPPSGRTERYCSKDYPVPGTNHVIGKDTVVLIPILSIHRDPNYYPDPEKFIPERFSQENKATRHSYSYLPFGIGPRNCIGMRFALVKVKTVIAQLVRSYQFSPCSQTKIPVDFDQNVIIKPKHGMWLNVKPRT